MELGSTSVYDRYGVLYLAAWVLALAGSVALVRPQLGPATPRLRRAWRLSDERCNWPNTLRVQREGSDGDRDTGGREPTAESEKTLTPEEVERAAVRVLVKAARARGDDLTGPVGLLKAITKQVIEAALEEEMTEGVSPISVVVCAAV